MSRSKFGENYFRVHGMQPEGKTKPEHTDNQQETEKNVTNINSRNCTSKSSEPPKFRDKVKQVCATLVLKGSFQAELSEQFPH
jgi:hypothetical protein